jgi:DNA-directed RNA polymerase specialized sigma24 family protein
MTHAGDVGNDIVTFGGPGRGSRESEREAAGETFESLFRSHFQRLADAAFPLVGDRELARELAQEAFLRLWHRSSLTLPGGFRPGGRWTRDQEAAWLYLRRSILKLAQRRVGAAWPAASSQPARAADEAGQAAEDAGQAADEDGQTAGTRRAWEEFEYQRSRRSRKRGIGLALAAAVVVAAGAIAYPAISGGSGSTGSSAGFPSGFTGTTLPPTYPGAIVARIPVGGVVSMAVDGQQAWAVGSVTGLGGVQSYQLVKIDLTTNKVMLRMTLGSQAESVAAVAGTVWRTTPYGRGRGQLVRVDPATGKVVRTLHLLAGRCYFLGYSAAGFLVANCDVRGPLATDFVRINPLTGRVAWQESAGPGQVTAVAVTPQSVWYVNNFLRIDGLIGATDNSMRAVGTADPAYQAGYSSALSLAYGMGSLWALGDNESVARVSPVTGNVQHVYTKRTLDPGSNRGLTVLAVTRGSIWILADGYPASGVLQVSPATGRPIGLVPIATGSCGQQACSQIYSSPDALWVPTLEQLLRIDPARIRGPKRYPSAMHPAG